MTRIDVWLCSVRAYKSRSLATDAVKGGHIRLNGDPVKPSHDVKPGDVVTIRTPGWDRVLKVVDPISKRVGAKLAVLGPPTCPLPSLVVTVELDDPPRRTVARLIGFEAVTLTTRATPLPGLAPRAKSMYVTPRRIRLEAYGARLESGLGSRPHEFESRILRGRPAPLVHPSGRAVFSRVLFSLSGSGS